MASHGPVLGEGDYQYRPVRWPERAEDLSGTDVAGVVVDADDNVITFSRSHRPLAMFSREGRRQQVWGENVFTNPHSVSLSQDGLGYWCTDDGDHTARKITASGQVLIEIGTAGRPADFMGGHPFRRCTQAAVSSSGDVFVSDGYGNARVHRFDPEGRHVSSFGSPGVGPGEFNLPHGLACVGDWLYVADRENHRIQVFDLDGVVQGQWLNLHRPAALTPLPDASGAWVVAELGPMWPFSRGAPNLGPRLSLVSGQGEVLARLAGTPAAGLGLGQFVAPHAVAVDSRGDIYVGQVVAAGWPSMFPDQDLPAERPSIVKLVRLPAT